jgi:DNA-binding MarR family transcriptional regulator
VDITAAGRSQRAELHEAVRERLAELLDNLSAHDEATFGLAMRVALPLIDQLTRHAAENPQPQPASAS